MTYTLLAHVQFLLLHQTSWLGQTMVSVCCFFGCSLIILTQFINIVFFLFSSCRRIVSRFGQFSRKVSRCFFFFHAKFSSITLHVVSSPITLFQEQNVFLRQGPNITVFINTKYITFGKYKPAVRFF